ncbi:MAG TPA: Ig-like domain-containing protein [Flavisolibacter sp.]|jgi:hypothetical protein|nr:Ig-like domain-containing protein [Flavisolibacter sp.]
MKPAISLLLGVCFIAIVFLFGSSCANIIPPQGGPRDTIPPRLLNVSPPDSSLNFRGNRITLSFDEYVDLQDVQNSLVFTPTFENNPTVSVKGREINVRFKDSLTPNTTYVFNFGNAIRDFNESNILKNYTYTFSTGPYLDSLQLKGKVILAENNKTDSTLVVVLHRDLSDSAVRKRPPYFARVDANGNFLFKNLPAGTFRIFAIGDAGLTRQYLNSKSQYFAFADSAINTAQQQGDITLYAWKEADSNALKLPAVSIAPGAGRAAPGAGRATTGAQNRLTFTNNLSANTLELGKDLVLQFPSVIRRFDSAQLQLTTDTSFIRQPFTARQDSNRKQLTISTAWVPGTAYNLILGRDFAEDSTGKKLLKTDTLTFSTKRETDYGNVLLRIKNVKPEENPVLQLLQNDQVIYWAPASSGVVNLKRFNPGDYDLRLLYDRNNNGKWDPGSYYGVKRQPERVRPLDRKISVKAGFDNEIEIAL